MLEATGPGEIIVADQNNQFYSAIWDYDVKSNMNVCGFTGEISWKMLELSEEISSLKYLSKIYSINLVAPVGFDFEITDLCELNFILADDQKISFNMKSMDFHHYPKENTLLGDVPGVTILSLFEKVVLTSALKNARKQINLLYN